MKVVFTDRSRKAVVEILYDFANRVERENGEQIFQLMTVGSHVSARPFHGDHPVEVQRVINAISQIEGVLDVKELK